jgi:hypothetical protein
MEEIIAYGGIPEAASKGLRSSGRIRAQPTADCTQMERAMGLAQAKNSTSGTSSITKLSFCDLSDDVVVHRASKLGVLFGNTLEEIACSVKKIKRR